LNAITLGKGGWIDYDASTGALPVLGCGIDGNSINTTTATATFSIGNLVTTALDIYYRQTTGTFRWRVDSGAWTAVTGTGTNALGKVSISGLADSAHTIQLDTVGNTGTVSIYGFRATRPSVAGVELLKAGNGSLDSTQWVNYLADYLPGILTDVQPDLVIVALGTNDYRRAVTPAQYITAMSTLVSSTRAVSPNTGFVFLAPADSNATASTPLTAFRDALFDFCRDNNHAFYNHHDDWADYDAMNALGVWQDALHVNAAGARLIAKRIHTLLTSI
jgi:lysophospholipase L1-like esterase